LFVESVWRAWLKAKELLNCGTGASRLILPYLEQQGISRDMTRRKTNPDFLNGVPELLLLELLARRGMYGYEIVQAIGAATAGRLEFGEGCIYPVLHRLEAEGCLASKREECGGRTRIVYRVTAAGKKRLAASRETWRQVAAAIENVLQGGTGGTDGQVAVA
jgi:PadR family transcriptional regulator, regulatory protein PadR